MEEDIKILEEFIEYVKKKDEIKFISPTEIHAIENLIARNKELEKHYQHEQEYIKGEVFSAKQMYYIEENYIDKSKVREKIEAKISYCRLEQIEGESTEGENSLHKKYWEMYEDLLEKLKEQLLED